jgi:hypothetical protein
MSNEQINWEKVRIDAAIAAMQGMLADTEPEGSFEDYARCAVKHADTLVAELRKEETK